jgi:hypothetical protein
VDLATDLPLERAGRYPVVLTVDYADANRYPFSATSVTHFVHQENLSPRVFGTLQNTEISKSGSLRLAIKNLDGKDQMATIRLILPKELSSTDLMKTVSLKGRSEDSVNFKIKNFSALPGSTYSIFALLGYDEGNLHYSTSVGGSIKITQEDSGFVQSNRSLLIGIAIILGVAFIYLNLRSLRAKRAQQVNC